MKRPAEPAPAGARRQPGRLASPPPPRPARAHPAARRGPSRTRPRPATVMAMARSTPRSLARPAPGAGGSRPARPPRQPDINDRLAPPETRLEYLHGIEMFAAPALPPHATLHASLAYVLLAHAAPRYRVAVDMLTRTSETSDFAPDASIYPEADDPKTGGRRLEELAFEVTNRQALSVPTEKARELVRRGVRRVFCLLVGKKRVLEWSRETDGWQPLGVNAVLKDHCLVRPLPIRALLEAAEGDEAVVAALRARKVPALMAALADERREGKLEGRAEGKLEGRAEGKAEGKLEGRAEGKLEGRAEGKAEGKLEGRAEGKREGRAEGLRTAVADLCELLGIALSPSRQARLEAMGVDELEALRLALKRTRRWPGVPPKRSPAKPPRAARPAARAKKR
jgi:putative restriction endonuclease